MRRGRYLPKFDTWTSVESRQATSDETVLMTIHHLPSDELDDEQITARDIPSQYQTLAPVIEGVQRVLEENAVSEEKTNKEQ